MMPAIADVTVTDPETYAGYRALTPGSIAAFGGRFLVQREHEVIAGGWAPGRLGCWSSTAWRAPPRGRLARLRGGAGDPPAGVDRQHGHGRRREAPEASTRSCATGPMAPASPSPNVGAFWSRDARPRSRKVRGPARGSRCSNSTTVRRRRPGAKRRRSGRQGTRRCWSRVLDPSYAGAPTMPRSCSAPMAPSPRPSTSARISSVCSPRRGPGLTASRGAAAKSSGEPGVSRAPIPG